MKLIAWSGAARKDLEEVFSFYLLRNPSVAARIHDSIIDEVNRLGEWPEIGRHEEFIDIKNYKYPFRSLITSNGLYKIIYFTTEKEVVIARIWSCRQNPANLKV